MPAAPVTGSGLNPSTLNKLKRVFKGDADLTDLTQRVETLETNFTALSAAVGDSIGFKIVLTADREFSEAGTVSTVLAIDRFSEVGEISIDTPNCVVPAGFSIGSLALEPSGVSIQLSYDGSQANGTYPLTVALIATDGSTDTITFNITVNA